jgi:hypothetical protein
MVEPKATAIADPVVDSTFLDKLLHNQLTEQEAWQFVHENPKSTVFTMLMLHARYKNVATSKRRVLGFGCCW